MEQTEIGSKNKSNEKYLAVKIVPQRVELSETIVKELPKEGSGAVMLVLINDNHRNKHIKTQ